MKPAASFLPPKNLPLRPATALSAESCWSNSIYTSPCLLISSQPLTGIGHDNGLCVPPDRHETGLGEMKI